MRPLVSVRAFEQAGEHGSSLTWLPIVTVPMGSLGDEAETRWDDTRNIVETAPGFVPAWYQFMADRWMEERLISYACAYEQASKRRGELRPYIEPECDLGGFSFSPKL